MRFYEIDERYIDFLGVGDKRVMHPHTKEQTRKYIGVLFRIQDFTYFAPLSSPSKNDYKDAGTKKNDSLKTKYLITRTGQLVGKIQLKNMIPVPPNAVINFDIKDIEDEKYRNLLKVEYRIIEAKEKDIHYSAKHLYMQRNQEISERMNQPYIKSMNWVNESDVINFPELEFRCNLWKQMNWKPIIKI